MKEFEGLYISEEIWFDKNLSLTEKCVLATNRQGIYFDDNTEGGNFFGLSAHRYWEIKKTLRKKGYVVDEPSNDPEEVVEKLKNKTITKEYTCEWCNEKVTMLQEHHYPIPKAKGGENVVYICPNCHYTFHKLVGNKWCKE
jgi:DNA-directed RNA polymerase subunit RPC12/RpoP